jgi:twinkle protein
MPETKQATPALYTPLSKLTGKSTAKAADLVTQFKRFRLDIPGGAQTGIVMCHCPECLDVRKKKEQQSVEVNLDEGSWICQHCGYMGNILTGTARRKGPFQWIPQFWRKPNYDQGSLPPALIQWFKTRSISSETLDRNKIGHGMVYVPKHEEMRPCVKFPYFLGEEIVSVKYRDKHKTFHIERGCESTFYHINSLNEETTILVEAEIDVLSMEECGIFNAMGVPFTPGAAENNYEDNFEYLLAAEKELTAVKKFVLAFSNTEPGRRLEEEIARRLGKERCWRVTWPEDIKDANQMLTSRGPEAIKEAIDKARPYPIKGIFEAFDVADKIDALYAYGLPRGVETGWPSMSENYTVKEGQWTLVTGIPGHGKSNILDAMLVNVATKENWRFGMFSPENQPIERHFANLMEKYADAPFSFGSASRMTEEMKDNAKEWVNDHFFVILPDEEDGNWSIDGILQLAKALVFRKGIKGLVIDPWNELDHSRTPGVTETEHISQALTKIRQFARSHAVHVWVVAHPAKLYKDSDGRYPVPTPYDVSGSSHWNNKADNAMSIWRNRGGKDEDIADVHIQKIRFKEVGRVGVVSLRYNKLTGRFIDDIDQAKREESREKGLELPTDDLRIFSKRPK